MSALKVTEQFMNTLYQEIKYHRQMSVLNVSIEGHWQDTSKKLGVDSNMDMFWLHYWF